jgi:hypothetical protein
MSQENVELVRRLREIGTSHLRPSAVALNLIAHVVV